MNFIKILLAIAGLLLVTFFAFYIIGLISTIIWYLFLLGVIGIGGAVVYQLFKKDKEPPQLKENTPTAIADMQNTDRLLEEYRRKYLEK